MSERERGCKEQSNELDLGKIPGRKPHKLTTVFGLSLLVFTGVTAWVLYLKYSI
jgi:hypothetical protein